MNFFINSLHGILGKAKNSPCSWRNNLFGELYEMAAFPSNLRRQGITPPPRKCGDLDILACVFLDLREMWTISHPDFNNSKG